MHAQENDCCFLDIATIQCSNNNNSNGRTKQSLKAEFKTFSYLFAAALCRF